MSRSVNTWLHSTLDPPSRAESTQGQIVTATIQCHADPGRIGERAELGELGTLGRSLISRTEPAFAPVAGGKARPLQDPFLSRQPLELLSLSSNPVRLELRPPAASARTLLNGRLLEEPGTLEQEALRRGVVLDISGRVALLLHLRRGSASGPLASHGLIGASERLDEVRLQIQQFAPLSAAVLLRGETGCGKELVARAIAKASPYGAPFVTVNMGAIPPSVATAQLFGSTRGAFTGAVATDGYFRRSEGGTLFLDEIGLVPPDLQSQLLRVLESGEIQPVGDQPPFRVKVRVIAATDSDLERKIQKGHFSQALLQRLGTLQVFLPPLRERLDDLGRLLVHFLRSELSELGAAHRLDPRPLDQPAWLPASMVAQLALHDWPGNVRELRNVARQIAIESRALSEAKTPTLLQQLQGARQETQSETLGADARSVSVSQRRLDDASIRAALLQSGRNFSRAARALGITRNTLYKRTRELGLYRPLDDYSAEELLAVAQKTGQDLDQMAEQLQVSRRGLALRLARLKKRA